MYRVMSSWSNCSSCQWFVQLFLHFLYVSKKWKVYTGFVEVHVSTILPSKEKKVAENHDCYTVLSKQANKSHSHMASWPLQHQIAELPVTHRPCCNFSTHLSALQVTEILIECKHGKKNIYRNVKRQVCNGVFEASLFNDTRHQMGNLQMAY